MTPVPRLTLIKTTRGLSGHPEFDVNTDQQREAEATRLNLAYTAALDRQARIRLADQIASTSRPEGAA